MNPLELYNDSMPKISIDTDIVFIEIKVVDPEKTLLLFDTIQVWRSVDNIQPYTELTAKDDLPAIINGTIDGTWALNTKTLTVVKNSADPITVTFTGADPWDLQSVINKINLQIPKLASQAGTNINRLRLTSDISGLASNLTISGTAASVLGLSTTRVIGAAHRPDLTTPTNTYYFYDVDGQPTYYYKIRFYNSLNGAVSVFTTPVQGRIQPILQAGDLVTASVTLSDETGMPIEGRRIILVPITDKKVGIASLMNTQNRIILTTNQYGFASTKIAKGITVRVFFEGSGFSREITTPTVDFDILTVATTYPDPFNIVTTPPLVIRVS